MCKKMWKKYFLDQEEGGCIYTSEGCWHQSLICQAIIPLLVICSGMLPFHEEEKAVTISGTKGI